MAKKAWNRRKSAKAPTIEAEHGRRRRVHRTADQAKQANIERVEKKTKEKTKRERESGDSSFESKAAAVAGHSFQRKPAATASAAAVAKAEAVVRYEVVEVAIARVEEGWPNPSRRNGRLERRYAR